MPRRKNDTFHISPTALQAWCECPAKLWWSQRWELRKPKDNFGSNVHRRMEDGSDYQPGDFEEVKSILPKLRKLEADLGYTVLGREVVQEWEIFPGVIFKRIMDVISRMPTGKLVIPDYKTCKSPWISFPSGAGELIAPKARTLQAAGYVMPPPEGILLELRGFTLTYQDHPTRAYFLMGPERGEAAWFPYDRDPQGDEMAFLHLARLAVESLKLAAGGVVIRNRGEACDNRRSYPGGKTYGWECDWKPICYDLPNWRKLFKKKER